MSKLDELVEQYRNQGQEVNPANQSSPSPLDAMVNDVRGVDANKPPADPMDLPRTVGPGESLAAEVSRRLAPGMRTGQMLGGFAGSIGVPLIAGRLIPGPVDDVLLGMASVGGAGIGGGVGEGVQQAVSPYEDVDFRKMGAAALAEGLAEGGGRMAGAVLSAIASKLVSKHAVQKFGEAILDKKIDPTDAGDRLYRFVGRKVDTPKGYTQGLLHKELDEYFGPAFTYIAAETAGGGVDLASLKAVAQAAIDAHEAGEKILPKKALKELKSVLDADDVVPFGWLRGHKTHWQGMNARLKRDAMVSDTGMLNLASEAKRLQTDPTAWLGISPDVAPQIAHLNRQYSQMEDLMNMVFPRRFTEALKAKPEKVIELIGEPSERTARGAWARQIQNTKKALTTMPDGRPLRGGREVWNNVREAWWTGQINKYASSGEFDTEGFAKMLNLLGDKATSALFEPGELKEMRELQKLLAKKNAKILSQGTFLGTIGVAGGVGAGLGWDVYHDMRDGDYIGVMKDGSIAMSAGVLAAAIRSPAYASIVKNILWATPGRKELVPQLVRLARFMARDKEKKEGQLRNDMDFTLSRGRGLFPGVTSSPMFPSSTGGPR